MNRKKQKKGVVRPISSAKRPARRGGAVRNRHKRQPGRPGQPAVFFNAHKRGRSINRSVTVVAGIFFIMVLVYLVQSLYAFVTKPSIPTEMVKIGSIDQPRVVSGIIVRDEYPYLAEKEGRVQYSINDYDRVKLGQTIGSIQNMEAVQDISRNMSDIEEQIIALQQMRQDISAVDPAVQRLNSQIKNIVDSRLHHFTSLNIAEVYALKESVEQSVNSRNQMILADNKDVREDLGTRQQRLISELNNHVMVIKAEQSGVMSPLIDGLEQVLTFESMKELSREQTQMKRDYDKIIPNKDVAVGDSIFKIVASNDWYIAAYMPNDLIEGFEVDDVRTLYIENKDEYIPLITRVHQIDKGYRDTFILFKCTKNIIDYMNMRNVNIKTTDSIHKGLKISTSAITTRVFLMIPSDYVYESDRFYVIKSINGEESVVPIVVADSDAEYTYVLDDVENLWLGDELIRTSQPGASYTLSETLTVQGVYKVNKGFAEFKKITLTDDELPTGNYAILNQTLNKGIKVYDYIVTDASSVRDGQIIQ